MRGLGVLGLQDPCPPWKHSSISLIGFRYDSSDERILLLIKKKACKNANHQCLGKDQGFEAGELCVQAVP